MSYYSEDNSSNIKTSKLELYGTKINHNVPSQVLSSFGLENPGTRVPLPMFCLLSFRRSRSFLPHRRDFVSTKQTTRDTTALCLQSQLHFHIPITLIRIMCLNDAYFLILT